VSELEPVPDPPLPVPPPLAPPVPAPAPAPAAPSLWPSLLAPIVGLVAGGLASGVAIVAVALIGNPDLFKGGSAQHFEDWMNENATTFPVIFAMLVPAQLAFFGIAVLFAGFDRERWRKRLGFVRPGVPFSTVALAALGTLGVHFLIGVVAGQLIDKPSSALEALGRMFTEPRGLAAVGVGFLMSVLPGLCEETLFRGFTQRGLLRRWPPVVAIGVTSLFFALAHFDVQHSLAVIPLGAWLGFIAWKTGSVWPTVLAHFTNNAVAFVALRLGCDPQKLGTPGHVAYYGVGLVLVALTVVASVRLSRTKAADSVRYSGAPGGSS
jgi:membrane protease YdiL (CAAX protease family)